MKRYFIIEKHRNSFSYHHHQFTLNLAFAEAAFAGKTQNRQPIESNVLIARLNVYMKY